MGKSELRQSFPGTVVGNMKEPQEKTMRVVCIEDEAEMIELVNIILSKHGFEVIGATDGHDGLEKITTLKPDLVLLDLMMPDMDGWDVYQQMKADEDLRDIPVIVVTAKAQSIDKLLGLHIAKVEDYITKPFGPADLLESVDRVLKRKPGDPRSD